jgi:hypothetical protein
MSGAAGSNAAEFKYLFLLLLKLLYAVLLLSL